MSFRFPKMCGNDVGKAGAAWTAGERDLSDVVIHGEPEDAPNLVHAHAALQLHDVAVKFSPDILKIRENERLCDVKNRRR